MGQESVEVKSKGQVVGTLDYEFPDTLEDALEVDGEEKVYKLYTMQRKIRAIDAKRRELTGGGLPRALVKALKSADPDVIRRIAEEMGLDIE